MKRKETLKEALMNPKSNFRNEMLEWWKEYINLKDTKNEKV